LFSKTVSDSFSLLAYYKKGKRQDLTPFRQICIANSPVLIGVVLSR
jgi:hypothetical protein